MSGDDARGSGDRSDEELGRYLAFSRQITGWTRGAEALALAHAARLLAGDAVIVEIGSFLGGSAVLLAGARKIRGSGMVHCVDPFDASGDAFSVPVYREITGALGGSIREAFEANLRRAGLSEWVAIHQGRATNVAAGWAGQIDLLFLDGDQSYEGVRAAYAAWSPFLRLGGILAVHNSTTEMAGHDGHRRLVREHVRAPEYADVVCIGTTTFANKLTPAEARDHPVSTG